jgi:hypothetical protein
VASVSATTRSASHASPAPTRFPCKSRRVRKLGHPDLQGKSSSPGGGVKLESGRPSWPQARQCDPRLSCSRGADQLSSADSATPQAAADPRNRTYYHSQKPEAVVEVEAVPLVVLRRRLECREPSPAFGHRLPPAIRRTHRCTSVLERTRGRRRVRKFGRLGLQGNPRCAVSHAWAAERGAEGFFVLSVRVANVTRW